MKKKELQFIQQKIDQYLNWSKEEEKEARTAETTEEKDYHLFQARLNDSAANALENLLIDLENLTPHKK